MTCEIQQRWAVPQPTTKPTYIGGNFLSWLIVKTLLSKEDTKAFLEDYEEPHNGCVILMAPNKVGITYSLVYNINTKRIEAVEEWRRNYETNFARQS